MARSINLQAAVNAMAAGRVGSHDDVYFAVCDKMAELDVAPVRKAAVKPDGTGGATNVRGILNFIGGCGVVDSELAEGRQAEVTAAESQGLQCIRKALENRYAVSGYTPVRPDPESPAPLV